MIDIHCHILPDFDDGAADLDESLGMARAAAASGVTGIVVTPHFRGEPESLGQLPRLVEQYQLLREALRQERIPLQLHLGAEILCLPQTIRLARQKMLPTISRTNYVLCEFLFGESPVFMNKLLCAIAAAGYRVVVAHPERYEAVQKDLRLVEHWFRQGYVLQLNKGSVLGSFGPGVQQTAEMMLENGFAHMLASDAHSTLYRTAEMGHLRSWVNAHYPPEYARVLMEENPDRLLRGEDMVPPG